MKKFEEMTMEELKKLYNEKLKRKKKAVNTRWRAKDGIKRYYCEVE